MMQQHSARGGAWHTFLRYCFTSGL